MFTESDFVQAEKAMIAQKIGEIIVENRQSCDKKVYTRNQISEEERHRIQTDLEDTIMELLEQGVEIKQHIETSRRVVFKGRYKGKDVVIKFAVTNSDIESNTKEHRIYQQALRNNDQDHFAQIYLISEDSRAIIQEYCDDIQEYEEWRKPKDRWHDYYAKREEAAIRPNYSVDYQKLSNLPIDIAIKYKIYEIQKGKTKKGKLVFVDYGT